MTSDPALLSSIVPWLVKRAGVDGDRAAGQLAGVDLQDRRAAGEHLDAVDLGIAAGAVGEGHRDLATGVGRGRKGLLDRLVLAPRRGEDVEIRQHLRAVDAHVELLLACRRYVPVGGEIQGHRVACPRRQAAQVVAETARSRKVCQTACGAGLLTPLVSIASAEYELPPPLKPLS